MEKKWVLAIFAFILLISVSSVMAADILAPIMNIGAGLDIGKYVNDPNYYPFIDAVIYFILFIGLAMVGLGKFFGESKLVPVTIGIILALSMTGFEYYYKWRLMVALSMWAWIFVLAALGVMCYYVTRRFTENIWIPLFIAMLVVGGLFGSAPSVQAKSAGFEDINSIVGLMETIAFLGLIFTVVGKLFGRKRDSLSGSELSNTKSIFPKSEEAANTIKDVDSKLEKDTKDKAEKDMLEEAKEETKLTEDLEGAEAEGAIESAELEHEKQAEEKKNSYEKLIMDRLIKDSDMITNFLDRPDDPNNDAVLKQQVIRYLKDVTSIGEALEQNDRIAIKERIDLLSKSLANTNQMGDILDKTMVLDRNLRHIEKNVVKNAGTDLVDHLKTRIKAMEAQRKALIDTYDAQIKSEKEVHNEIGAGQATKLREEAKEKFEQAINLQKANLATVERTVDEFMKKYSEIVESTIAKIRSTITEEIRLQRDLKKRIGNAYTLAQRYDKYMKDFDAAVEQIKGVAHDIESSEDASSEATLLTSKAAVQRIIAQLSNINHLTITLFRDNILRFIMDFEVIESKSAALANSVSVLNSNSILIQQRYEEMKKKVGLENDPKVIAQSENIKKVLMAIGNLYKTASQERQQVITRTLNQLNQTKNDITTEVNKMLQEDQQMNNAQLKVMNAFDRSMSKLSSMRFKQSQNITNTAEKTGAAVAQATQNLVGAERKL